MYAAMIRRSVWAIALVCATLAVAAHGADEDQLGGNSRLPKTDTELRSWLENMVWHHRFTTDEIVAATGLDTAAVQAALRRFDIRPSNGPTRNRDAALTVLPYPGGRHPRIGFLDGAINPQRETKISIFTPWDPASYVVVDVPEAIWQRADSTPRGRELLYLAHTHVETVWTRQGIELGQIEWTVEPDGVLHVERTLPNAVSFAARVVPDRESVRMEIVLKNGSQRTIRDARVQVCALLKGAAGFAELTNENKHLQAPYVACGDARGRWIITAWQPLDRAWANQKCPCMHADPRFPDCPPGESSRVWGRLWFYVGDDLEAELRRIDGTAWAQPTTP